MKGVSDEVWEIRGRRVGGRGRLLVWTMEEVVDVASAHLGCLLMTVVLVL
jgi:hypothetical protein